MPACAVATCTNYNRKTKGTGIKYFTFPKNEDLAKQWIHACSRGDEINLQNACVCSIHFESHSFEVPMRQRMLNYTPKRSRNLKTDAVPVLHLPGDGIIKRRQRSVVTNILKESDSIGPQPSICNKDPHLQLLTSNAQLQTSRDALIMVDSIKTTGDSIKFQTTIENSNDPHFIPLQQEHVPTVAMEQRPSDSEVTWGIPLTQHSIQHVAVHIKQELPEDYCAPDLDLFGATTEADFKNFDVLHIKVECDNTEMSCASLKCEPQLKLNNEHARGSASTQSSCSTLRPVKNEEDHHANESPLSIFSAPGIVTLPPKEPRRDKECKVEIEDDVPYQCEPELGKQQELRASANDSWEDPTYRCTECSFTTRWKYNLSKHFKGRHNKDAELYKCPHCDFATKYKHYFNQHLEMKHDPNAELYKCPDCDYATKCKSYLTTHINRKHSSDTAEYRCAECSYTTKWNYSLSTHVKVHHDEHAEIHRCPHCEFTTKFKHNYARHLVVKHDPEAALHKCTVCEFETKDARYFARHVAKQHSADAEVYRCVECSYATKWKSSLSAHVSLHHNEHGEVYKCASCDFSTKHKTYLVRHFRSKHDAS